MVPCISCVSVPWQAQLVRFRSKKKRDLARRSFLPGGEDCSARATGRTPAGRETDQTAGHHGHQAQAGRYVIYPPRPRGATRLGTTTTRWGSDRAGSAWSSAPDLWLPGRDRQVSSHRLLSGSPWQLVPPVLNCRERGVSRGSSCTIQNIHMNRILRQLSWSSLNFDGLLRGCNSQTSSSKKIASLMCSVTRICGVKLARRDLRMF